jgi:hypothetical protein
MVDADLSDDECGLVIADEVVRDLDGFGLHRLASILRLPWVRGGLGVGSGLAVSF